MDMLCQLSYKGIKKAVEIYHPERPLSSLPIGFRSSKIPGKIPVRETAAR